MELSPQRCSLLAVCLLGLLLQQLSVCQAEAPYKRLVYNKTCRYAAFNVSRSLFFNGQYEGMSYAFPLETGHAASYGKPWQACFGPSDTQQLDSYRDGQKLPCFYRINRWGTIDFWEEHACDVLLKANCYCFAINRYMGSYCEPGLGGTGQSFKLPVLDCEASVAGIVADGAKPISRQRAYALQGSGWVIALAVKPGTSLEDTGDFHFWWVDEGGKGNVCKCFCKSGCNRLLWLHVLASACIALHCHTYAIACSTLCLRCTVVQTTVSSMTQRHGMHGWASILPRLLPCCCPASILPCLWRSST
jgi:hypothetical protein